MLLSNAWTSLVLLEDLIDRPAEDKSAPTPHLDDDFIRSLGVQWWRNDFHEASLNRLFNPVSKREPELGTERIPA